MKYSLIAHLTLKWRVMKQSNKQSFAYTFIFSLSFLIIVFLFWFIYFKPEASASFSWVSSLPLVNAVLNSLCSLFLVGGYIAIKKRNIKLHIRLMSLATVVSALFLVSYLIYHHFQGDTKFIASGVIRVVYFIILISHIILSIVQVPMIFITLWNAFTNNFDRHVKWARYTFPVWLYVSVTGVLVYLFLNYLNN